MQITNNILMIRPVKFRYNEQTATNNYYQKFPKGINTNQINKNAQKEFDQFVNVLRDAGVNLAVINDTDKHDTPDSIFPNNWVSFHRDGSVVMYPMYAYNRREERRLDIFDILKSDYKFKISKIIDYTSFEKKMQYLEGTGSMVLDRENKICYAALSERTNKITLNQFCKEFGYRPVIFEAKQDLNGKRVPIYHTNVMMCVANNFAIVCLESIDNLFERDNLINELLSTKKNIIEITEIQKEKFAGNMLQVIGKEIYLVMSESAFMSLTKNQISEIEEYCKIIYSPLNTIETFGGGSARCMMAEIFLPN